MEEIIFAKSRPYTLGVELEFQVLDEKMLDLVSTAPAILADVPPALQDKVAPEFMRSMLEVQTGVCASVDEVAMDLKSTILRLEQIAAGHGCLLYSASLHPFAEPSDQVLSVGARYQRIMDELQLVGRRFISQGLHVHVGIEHRDSAIAVCDVLQVYLPILLGLSCSSPYFRGADTGLSSYRTKLFEALPLAGKAGYIGSWQGYVDEINLLRAAHVLRDTKDLWWDIRPSPGFGTVEIRICDLPARFVEVLGLTSIIQALAAAVVESVVRPRAVSPQLLSANKWQAARHGLEGRFTDPLALLPTKTQTIRSAAREMLAALDPFFDRFGGRGLDSVRKLLDKKTSADRQRELMEQYNDFGIMITKLRNTYWHE